MKKKKKKKKKKKMNDIKKLTQEIDSNPSDVKYTSRGVMFMKLRKYEDAIRDFTKAIHLNPRFFIALNNRGLCYFNRCQYVFAISDYTKAIEIKAMPTTHKNRGLSYHKLKKYEDALKDYSIAFGMNPRYYKAIHNYGQTLVAMNKFKEAIEYYNRSLEIHPKDSICLGNLGICLFELKEYGTSVRVFTSSINLNSNSFVMFYQRGISLYFMNQINKAILDLEQSLLLNAYSWISYFYLGCCHQVLGNFKKAIDNFTVCIENEIKVLESFSYRAFCKFSLGEINSAKSDHEKASRFNKYHPLIYKHEGLLLIERKLFQAALQKLKKYIHLTKEEIGRGLHRLIDKSILQSIKICNEEILKRIFETKIKKVERENKKLKEENNDLFTHIRDIQRNEILKEEQDESDARCPICLTSTKNTLCSPCGHVFCETCIQKIDICAICRTRVDTKIKIYI